MSASTKDLSDTEVLERFAKLVTICRDLKARGKLYSGFEFGVRNNKIHAEPIPTTMEGMDFPTAVGRQLASFQQVRHWLGQSFDLNSEDWNNSSIGRMLNYVEGQFRRQTNKTQDAAGVYDPLSIVFLSDAMVRIVFIVGEQDFWKMSQKKQLKRLNQEAGDFFRRNRNRVYLQQLGAYGEMALALETLRSLIGEGEDLLRLLRPLAAMLETFERYQKSE